MCACIYVCILCVCSLRTLERPSLTGAREEGEEEEETEDRLEVRPPFEEPLARPDVAQNVSQKGSYREGRSEQEGRGRGGWEDRRRRIGGEGWEED